MSVVHPRPFPVALTGLSLSELAIRTSARVPEFHVRMNGRARACVHAYT